MGQLRAGAGRVTSARPTPHDVVQAEIHRKAMDSIAMEMGITLVRTSGSPVVTEAKDLSCSVLDERGEQIGYASFVGLHVSTSFLGVAAVLDAYSVDELEPGQAFIANDPHTSGALHEGDVGLVMPYFQEGELVGWGYVNEHMLDVGGSGVSGFAPEARDCFSEGLRFPALRVVHDGELDRDWVRFVANNVRSPTAVINDLRSMLAALNIGRARLLAALADFGLDVHRRHCEVNKRLSEEMARMRIAELPDGRYRSVDWVEYDGDGTDGLHELGLELEVEGSELTLRFSGVEQIAAPVNGARPAVMGQAMNTLQCTYLHDVPANAGLWRPVGFDLGRPGSIVNSRPPAAVCFAHVGVGMRVDKLVRDTLTQAMSLSESARVRARVAGQPCEGTALVTLSGIERATGRNVVLFPVSPTVPLGGPAQSVGDGLDTYSNTCNIGKGMAAVEMDEATMPVRVLWRRIEPSSGGAGITRGGQGMTSAMELVGVEPMSGTVSNNCSLVPPRGAGGGMTGACTEYELLADTNVAALQAQGRSPTPETISGRRRTLPQHAHLTVAEGEVFVFVNGGGGGLGDPLLRDPELVAVDVASGYVSERAAGELHGVVIDAGGQVDRAATERRRGELRTARLGAHPTREAGDRIEVGIGIRAGDSDWRCGYCEQPLGPLTGNYRDVCVSRSRPVVQALGAAGMRVRPRRDGPPLLLVEHYCPGCAHTVRTDVVLDGAPESPAPALARVAQGQTSPRVIAS
jgi:N-methylhydantoinase B